MGSGQAAVPPLSGRAPKEPKERCWNVGILTLLN
jgi:hypothetical protein